MIFETHAHYHDKAFDTDRDELLMSMRDNGIGKIIDVSAEDYSLSLVKELVDKYPFIYGAYGLHPSEIKELDFSILDTVRSLLKTDKAVAVGEIGLDYYWDKDNEEQQKDWFVRQIDIAREERKPVIVHSREAAKDTVDIARGEKMGYVGGVIHCFSYSKETAREFLDMGLYLGIGGVSTFKNARKVVETIEYAPVERLLLETDCPYMAPVPYRGKRNCSLYLPYVAQKIAEIKGMTAQEVIEITEKNAEKLFLKIMNKSEY